MRKEKWSLPSGRDTDMSRVGQVVQTDRCKAGEQNLQEKQSLRGSARVFCASVGIRHEVNQKGVQVGQVCNVLSTVAKRGKGASLTFRQVSGRRRSVQVSRPLVGPCWWGSARCWADVYRAERGSFRCRPGVGAPSPVICEWILWTVAVVGHSGPTLGGS